MLKRKPKETKSVHMLVWNNFLHDARVLKEAQTLQAAGYQLCVYAVHQPGVTKEQEFLEDGIEVRRIKAGAAKATHQKQGYLKKVTFLSAMHKIIQRSWWHIATLCSIVYRRPNVVHAHDVNTLPTAWLASRLAGAKLVYDAHEISTSREGYNSIRKWVARVEAYLMPKADGVITTTDMRAKYFARAYKVPRPLVLQNRPRYKAHTKTNKIREQLGLSNEKPIVIYQGGLQQGRGLELLVEAAFQVPGAYFVFVGSGHLTNRLKVLVAELNLQDRVFFIPAVLLAELPAYTASADLGVQLLENTCFNHYTTDSNKLFEYIHAGLPVVATDFPEIRKVIDEHKVGLLVPEGDLSEIVKVLNSLIESQETRRQFAERSLLVAKDLSWEEQESSLIKLYNRILPPN